MKELFDEYFISKKLKLRPSVVFIVIIYAFILPFLYFIRLFKKRY